MSNLAINSTKLAPILHCFFFVQQHDFTADFNCGTRHPKEDARWKKLCKKTTGELFLFHFSQPFLFFPFLYLRNGNHVICLSDYVNQVQCRIFGLSDFCLLFRGATQYFFLSVFVFCQKHCHEGNIWMDLFLRLYGRTNEHRWEEYCVQFWADVFFFHCCLKPMHISLQFHYYGAVSTYWSLTRLLPQREILIPGNQKKKNWTRAARFLKQ